MEAFIHPLNPNWFIASNQYGGRRLSKDAGLTTSGASPAGSSPADWLSPIAYDPNDHMTVYDFRDSIYGNNPDPCGTTFGEVEDYTILLQSSNTPLSLGLLDFNAIASPNGNMQSLLNWEMESTNKIARYEILHSTNGADFTTFKIIQNDNLNQQFFNTTHDAPIMGENYYKLRMIDLSEKSFDSKTKMVRFSGVAGQVTISPNPTRDAVTISWSAEQQMNTTIILSDVNGKVIQKKIMQPAKFKTK